MKYTELKEGEIYKSFYKNQGWYIIRMGTSNFLNIERPTNMRNPSYGVSGNITPSNGFKEFIKATLEEKEHFLQCEKAGKYVEYKPEIVGY